MIPKGSLPSAKLAVPSSGSMIQHWPDSAFSTSGSAWAASSPTTATPGASLVRASVRKASTLAVDDGDGIVHPLHLDLVRGELAKTRQHRTLGGKAHQIAQFGHRARS